MTRRYPISVGDRVQHMDEREGVVVRLIDRSEMSARLPGARVRWDTGSEEDVVEGFIHRIGQTGRE